MYTDPMARVRRITGLTAAAWLVVQTATLVLAPAFFVAGSHAAPLECTCVHDGNHRDCPMHHGSPTGARICFQTTESTGVTVLTSMLGHVALVPRPPATLLPNPAPLAAHRDALPRYRTLAPPKPPPPRA